MFTSGKRRLLQLFGIILVVSFLITTFVLSVYSPSCQNLNWREWSTWSHCIESGNSCIKVRFRGCVCGLKAVDPTVCHKILGGEQFNTENCPSEYCNDKEPSSKIENERYLMMVPCFGPNNQYWGFKESLLIAKQIGRTFSLPHFLSHQNGGLRTFESTFDLESIQQYHPKTIDRESFYKICNYTINVLVWMRWEDRYKAMIFHYIRSQNLNVEREIFVPRNIPREELALKSYDHINSFFSNFSDSKCIALGAPFRNIWFAERERQEMTKYFAHAKEIRELALKAIQEMGVTNSEIIAYHWRYGEDSCAFFKVDGMDFCWGTSVFSWAKLEDTLYVLKSLINETEGKDKVLYLAISNSFNPKELLEKLQNGLLEINTKIVRATLVPTLASITDNYYLSLVEQEICALSSIFIASTHSTWSDWIVDWKYANGLGNNVYSMDSLFQKHKKSFVQLNLFVERQKKQESKV